ncbi:MAG TPA: hypothetical protein VE133_18875, partial [Candidatus Sulfotelmatobacter sp.]|nr:hypothetical protein [Candidatus Sulfotelmatobacter sp.]
MKRTRSQGRIPQHAQLLIHKFGELRSAPINKKAAKRPPLAPIRSHEPWAFFPAIIMPAPAAIRT